MRRRTVLAALGTTLVSAGCLDASAEGTTPDPAPGAPADDGSTPTADPSTPTDTPRTPDDPKTEPARGRFEGERCPSFTDTDRTVCWHSRGDADVYLAPSAQLFQPVGGNDAVETVTFTLHNEADESFRLNPYAWAVKRRTDDGWTHVAPDHYVEPLVELPPGETYRWILSRRTHPTPNTDRTLYPMVEVENGRHAFAVDGWFGERDETVECIALFDVRRVYVTDS